ncbi:unnamed protein product [Rodentolepis nana]|uniref:Reverse transcriptase n=1 Tax=Rodentolepis nana TaxID=102285 RepID=A0A0R3TJ77_RODNA|nr:unnamed protein product [Rodentolepis nana]
MRAGKIEPDQFGPETKQLYTPTSAYSSVRVWLGITYSRLHGVVPTLSGKTKIQYARLLVTATARFGRISKWKGMLTIIYLLSNSDNKNESESTSTYLVEEPLGL